MRCAVREHAGREVKSNSEPQLEHVLASRDRDLHVHGAGNKAGEDYMKGVKTIGPDNTLKLTVTVA